MKILLVGNGGREHAIAWSLSQSRHQPQLFFAQGNPGLAELGQRLDIEPTDIQGLLLFAQREKIDLTVVGPEVPLSLGLGDRFRAAGLKVFGPNQDGARLEASKAFAKELMAKHNIPTARYGVYTNYQSAIAALQNYQPPYVIKEDGLAAGKGVTIAENLDQAVAAIEQAMQKEIPVVIEEFMQGQELSVLAFCDGKQAIPCIAAQDYKRALDGNVGPNTGGMGAYAPVPLATPELMQRVQREILQPTVNALRSAGIDYRGILYAGLMISPDGTPKVVEFNARFGDPETQVVLPLLQDDLVDLMLAVAQGDLSPYAGGLRFQPDTCAVTVVLTSQGYPGDYPTGVPIFFPQYLSLDTHIFHAGTRLAKPSEGFPEQTKVTAGGRVLNVTGLGKSLAEARQRAYAVADQIKFETKTCRRDIAAIPAGIANTP